MAVSNPYGNRAKFLKQCVFFTPPGCIGSWPRTQYIQVVETFGPDLPLLFELHEICSVESQENK